jgi:hypothetical protein
MELEREWRQFKKEYATYYLFDIHNKCISDLDIKYGYNSKSVLI